MNRQQHISETQTLQRKYESKYYPLVAAVIQAEVNDVTLIVQDEGIHSAFNHLHQLLTLRDAPAVIEELYKDVGLKFAGRQQRMFNAQHRNAPKFADEYYLQKSMELKGFGFNDAWVAFIKDLLAHHLLDKITFRMTETTRDTLLSVLQEAVEQGWGVDETVKHLEELTLSEVQAARIVRTEITRAANTGTMAASSTFQFEQNKEWIATHDTRTRGVDPKDHASHIGLDGQRIDIEDVFVDSRNGDLLRFPGDPLASAESTINCRCSMAIVAKRNSDGRLIPRRQTTSVIFPAQNRRRQIVTV